MADMYMERLEDLSVYYFLTDKFSASSFITIVDGFPEGKLVLPTIAIEAGKIDVRNYEMGNRDGIRVRRWYIDIYAKNKSQRDEFGYKLLNELKNNIPVYNYNEGFPPSVSPTKVGALQVLAKSYDPIRISADVVEKLYFRATISIVAENDVIQEV
jgi:hypothetical protein